MAQICFILSLKKSVNKFYTVFYTDFDYVYLISSFLNHHTASSVGWDPVPAKDLNSILNQTTDFTDQELPEMEVSYQFADSCDFYERSC